MPQNTTFSESYKCNFMDPFVLTGKEGEVGIRVAQLLREHCREMFVGAAEHGDQDTEDKRGQERRHGRGIPNMKLGGELMEPGVKEPRVKAGNRQGFVQAGNQRKPQTKGRGHKILSHHHQGPPDSHSSANT